MRSLPTHPSQPYPQGRQSLGVNSWPGSRSHTYLYRNGGRSVGQPSPPHCPDHLGKTTVDDDTNASSRSGHYATKTSKPLPHPGEKSMLGLGSISARDIQLYIDPGREEKHKIEKTLRRSSIVYAKKSPRRPKVYEHSKKIHHLASAEYRFTSPRIPELFPTLTTKLESHTSTFTPDRKSPSTRETTATVSLPPVPDPSLRASLLRRPTTIGTRPLEEKDEGFQAFANRLDLKPIIIDDSPSKTLRFYTHKYPLLLQKLLKEDRDKYVDRRSVNPNLGPDPLKRGSDVGKRLVVLNMALEELDKESTDCRFITELRDDTFDPRRWPWNRNRYQK